jgi:hypothetical protein
MAWLARSRGTIDRRRWQWHGRRQQCITQNRTRGAHGAPPAGAEEGKSRAGEYVRGLLLLWVPPACPGLWKPEETRERERGVACCIYRGSEEPGKLARVLGRTQPRARGRHSTGVWGGEIQLASGCCRRWPGPGIITGMRISLAVYFRDGQRSKTDLTGGAGAPATGDRESGRRTGASSCR